MSAVRTTAPSEAGHIEVLVNDEANTVTFVSDRPDAESTVPPTEWLTVSADSVVNLETHR